MTDEIDTKLENAEDGDKVAKAETKNDIETKEPKETKQRSVSFNRDVHVKRFGKPQKSRGTSSEHQSHSIRKEPFTHLSEQELIDEANKVLAQADSVTCTADHPPDKFFSLPHRRKFKEEKSNRRNSDDEGKGKSLGRSTSDVGSKRRKERTSLSTLFRRAQRNKSPDTAPVVVATKPVAVIKRSKSDVSDLKSNTKLNTQPRPIRKRSGSESEEFLKSLRNKKTQLSPIIESSPREDYFQKTSPLENLQLKTLTNKDKNKQDNPGSADENKSIKKYNPVEKPPRYKTPDKLEPKPPVRTKKGKSAEKDKSPIITETPKPNPDHITKLQSSNECDSKIIKKETNTDNKDKIKQTIRKIEENTYADKQMKHSSQLPPEKPPLTRGQTVDQIVKILKDDLAPHRALISSPNCTNTNKPFSYIKPSTSPDPNLFIRNKSPERAITPVNAMTDKGVVYAQVIRDRGDKNLNKTTKKAIDKKYSPIHEKYGNLSDEDEGLGYEDRYRFSNNIKYNKYNLKETDHNGKTDGYKIMDSPIKPIYREYKIKNFDLEPTYANEYNSKNPSQHNVDTFRGRADGMDTKRKQFDSENTKFDLDFNELSHRRQLLESRLNARRIERERNVGEPISRYLAETDPIYEAHKRMKATEKYVNETAKYYRHTIERDGLAESTITEDYSKYDSDNHKTKYNTETRTSQKISKGELERQEFNKIDTKSPYLEEKVFPPEPEYEPPSLEFNPGKPIHSPDEYQEKKYKVKKNVTSSHDILQTGHKYKGKDDYFGKRKGHYASNPEIAQEREDDYANLRYHSRHPESYHNSLRRSKSKERHYKENFGIYRHDSGDSRDYYRENKSPRRFEFDNRLVDSGIENDFRKDSSGEIHKTRHRRNDSYDDVGDTSVFLDRERQHTEDTYPSEQIYANGEYLAKFEDFSHEDRNKEFINRHRNGDGSSQFIRKVERYNNSPSTRDEKINLKPPKAKKLTGLEKMKQLFSRDSSKKSKKEKDTVQPKTRTRVLKSPDHIDDSDYRRYTDPEPSDIEVRRREYDVNEDDRRYRSSREDLDKQKQLDQRDSDPEKKYRGSEFNERYNRSAKTEKRHAERKEEKRRYHSSDRESDHHSRPSDGESDLRKSRSRTAGPMDSPAMAERYRGRRRLATPSPTPSPPRRQPVPPPQATSNNWFKSLDRLSKKKIKNAKIEKESILTTEDESTQKSWTKPTKTLNSPAKNLRFFGDTDPESDATASQHNSAPKSRSQSHSRSHSALRKTLSNSSTGLDEVDHSELSSKSYSLSNLHREEKSESPRTKQYYKRNLHNISEIQSNSENESHVNKKLNSKPPISPYERRSRSHSSSKTLKGNKKDVGRQGRNEDRGSSSELRSSRQELNRDSKGRRRTPGAHSGESSTEGESSHHSQRSVVFLHATTVGDIPDPGRLSRNRSRDDVSSVNSSNIQIKSTTKSFSIFAPWTPKHYNDQHDVHYAQRPKKTKTKENTFKKTSSSRTFDDRPSTLQKNKSYSQTTLTRRPQNNRLSSSSTTLYRKPEKRKENSNIHGTTLSRKPVGRDSNKSQSSELLDRNSDHERISRSISMPKDNNKKAGWFKLSSKNKKPEINTRVR